MPLSDEERQRIKEIELARAEAQQEAMQAQMPFSGPISGECSSCGRSLRIHWQFCTFCGAPSSVGCPRCHSPLPQEDGVQFCPMCGVRATR